MSSLRLFTLSPLHIGTGETLSPLEYVIDGQTFYRIGQEELYRFIRSELPQGQGAKAYNDWLAEQFRLLRSTRQNAEQSRLLNATNPLAFFESLGKRQQLLNYLDQQTGRAQVVRLDDDNRQRGRGPQNHQRFGEVREAMRTGPDHQLYLPGTTIKGAIRTALLYDVLHREGQRMGVDRIIDRQLRDRKRKPNRKYFAQELEWEIFFAGIQRSDGRTRRPDAQMDILKWLAVSDARLAEAVPANVAKINIYLVEKEQSKDRRDRPRLYASRQPQASYAEIIPMGQELLADWSFDGTSLHWVLGQATQKGIAVKGTHYYQSLGSKLSRLFNCPLDALKAMTPEELETHALNHCREALQRFCRRQLDRHQEWFTDYAQQRDPNRYADRIKIGYQPIETYAGQLLHLGYGAGFTSTTAFLFFLQDQNLRDLYERVMSTFQLGRAPRQKGPYNPIIGRFPKSRRFVESSDRIQPMGWMAILPPDAPLPTIELPKPDAIQAVRASNTALKEPLKPAGPEFPERPLDRKKQPEVDAVVSRSGRPNKVKLYLAPDDQPEIDLSNYRSPLEKGSILRVKVQFSKKGKAVQASFVGLK